MKPVKFKEANAVFAKNQPEYVSLPAYYSRDEDGHVISCWKLSFIERMRVLFTGKIWHDSLTFDRPLQPIFFTTLKKEIEQLTFLEKEFENKCKQ